MSRRLERSMRDHIIDEDRPPRGDSDTNTRLALNSIVQMSYAVPDDVVYHAVASLDSWVSRSEVALGLLEPLRSIPVHPQESEPRCPYCGYRTLRWRTNTGSVHCVNPDCFVGDPEDHTRPKGYIEMDIVSGRATIAWETENVS